MSDNQRVRVKICGITRVQDAIFAAHAGADAIGLVFHANSSRNVSIEQAARIVAELPPFVSVVGLFVDEPAARVREVMARVPLDILQFHGDETPDYCASFERRYIKAIAMREGVDLAALSRDYVRASALLVDAYSPTMAGGTGLTFDWQRLPLALDTPLILAGGLSPDNVAAAVQQVHPWGVDVSGGVEYVDEQGKRHGGIKSPQAINAFMQGVTRV